jgi:peroxiredoxin
MSRPIPLKLIVELALVAIVIIAAVGAVRQNLDAAPGPGTNLSDSDRAWLKERLARGAAPAPPHGMPQVLLLWREPMDAGTVRPLLPLVDHPEGLDGVYGWDATSGDRDTRALNLASITASLPANGSWLVVLDKYGHQIGLTALLNKDTINKAFEMARGLPVQFTDTIDPYINKPAPDFTTTTQDGNKPFTLSKQKGQKILLLFYCGCSKCQALGRVLGPAERSTIFNGVHVYVVTHMTPFHAKEFARQTGQTYMSLNETKAGIAGLYDSRTCPRVWFIGTDGRVRFYSRLAEDPMSVMGALATALQAHATT